VIVAEVLAEVGKMLDDAGLVHADASATQRQVNRAQQYVAIRFRLLRQTQPIAVFSNKPLYEVPVVFPNLIRVVESDLNGTSTLWPIPAAMVRLSDPQWLSTLGTPQWIYQRGLTWLGLYPVPMASGTANVTGIIAPDQLTTLGQSLQVPDAYLPRVIELAAGLVMLGSERAFAQGLDHITRGLQLKKSAA
jgi:hypothetical protein